MSTSLNDLSVPQQAELLSIVGRLLSLWYQSGKTEVPEGFGSLHNFAMYIALTNYDAHAYYVEAREDDEGLNINTPDGLVLCKAVECGGIVEYHPLAYPDDENEVLVKSLHHKLVDSML